MKELLRWLAGRWGHLVLKLLGVSTRTRIEGDSTAQAHLAAGKPCLLAIWHGKMLLPLYRFRYRDYLILVSRHRDGEVLARAASRLGYETIRGSSGKGGGEAKEAVQAELRRGRTVIIHPDGPTGPRHRLKAGVVVIAQRCDVPIIPVTFTAKRITQLRSWDRFEIWWPFSTSRLLIGAPLQLAPDLEVAEGMRLVEEMMLTQEAACN